MVAGLLEDKKFECALCRAFPEWQFPRARLAGRAACSVSYLFSACFFALNKDEHPLLIIRIFQMGGRSAQQLGRYCHRPDFVLILRNFHRLQTNSALCLSAH
jgi:hypothetical protein